MSENQINWAREIADEKRRDRIRDLERELAAMTADLKVLEVRHKNALEREHALSMRIVAMTAERDAFERLCIKQADRAELAERQVAILCKRFDDADNIDGACDDCPASFPGCAFKCAEAMAAWSRAEAERGKG
jgi:hypothetical protein